ncbi:lysine--tRNA ligase [Rivibacter subsaxonicus]|uniref:Lysine--tRNA ligase n=1 Tax=Rivibacter subsaxonicus TaxID=457575 RepID=A0A4Q7VGT3_9BURK|nr:lysine--tRNA ligase [Rivibacter subsaxonicus]RZT95227.1 lysyl-tRNA synthetase class II [Rivibacter subsaxonicus]
MSQNQPAGAQSVEAPVVDENQLIAERREKLAAIRAGQKVAFPNDFKPNAQAADLHRLHETKSAEELAAQPVAARIAGRMMLKRVMGKACFATLQDGSGRIQIYVKQDAVGAETLAAFKTWDLGDILGCEGTLFRTKTGELTLELSSLRLLVKSLRPLPDKFHGMSDQEQKYRQRYVDLIMDGAARERFAARSKAVASIRQFMVEHHFLEVETPMLHPIPGGANAKPFVTHHNALDQQMFLRIAPELYLKRLVVGGFERVFEINRNFRNEGISQRHNPEFTMMEFYAAYWDHRDIMDYTEAIIRHAARKATGSALVSYAGKQVDLESPFKRVSMRDSLVEYAGLAPAEADSAEALRAKLLALGEEVPAHWGLAQLQFGLFEAQVEDKLWQPTFIIDYPADVSPLARASDTDPALTERFELFATGREIANGFSELNDPEDQAARFLAQVANKDAGDEEAMYFDADYIRALEHGMPPTGGCGIGIDRLMMLITDSPSIRDVLLFPALRREG